MSARSVAELTRRPAGLLLLGATAFATLALAAPEPPVTAREHVEPAGLGPARVVVIGPSFGWIEPCGCSGGQLGGLHRLGSAMQIADPAPGSLRVAAGGAVAPEAAKITDWGRTQMDMLWSGYGMLGIDAVGVSSVDLELGVGNVESSAAFLFDAMTGVPATLVATNLVDAAGEWLFEPSAANELGNVNLLSFVEPGLAAPDGSWRTIGYDEALAKLEPLALLPMSIVALVEGDEDSARALAAQLDPSAVVLHHGVKGDADAALRPLADDGTMGAFLGARLRHVVRLDRHDSPEWQWYTRAVSEELQADEALDALRADYRSTLDAFGVVQQVADSKGAHPDGQFAGSAACADCHDEAWEIWEESLHSHAWPTLEADLRGEQPATLDPRCVYCHTVGFGYETGFASAVRTELEGYDDGAQGVHGDEHGDPLAAVGCESCHGPGAKHVLTEDPADIDLAAPVPGVQPMCVRCHDADNDPAFIYGKKWDLIAH